MSACQGNATLHMWIRRWRGRHAVIDGLRWQGSSGGCRGCGPAGTPEPRGRSRDGVGRWLVRRGRSEEHTSELQSRENLVCRLLLEKKKRRQRKDLRGSVRST